MNKILLALTMLILSHSVASAKCARLYYDAGNAGYTFGRTHALMLQNLMGHFPEIQLFIAPIETYQAGEIESCDTTFYLGTYYGTKVPAKFVAEFESTKKNVVWMGYGLWDVSPDIVASLFGMKVNGLSQLETNHRDERGRPEFYRFFEYKGQTFQKYGEFDLENHTQFNASAEITLLQPLSQRGRNFTQAWAVHSRTRERHPYLVRNANHWYVADSPFSFVSEEDRYLIFADALFDMLDEQPRHQGKHLALFRLEDVNVKSAAWQLYRVTDLLDRLKMPFSIALFPIFSDPLQAIVSNPAEKYLLCTQRPAFIDWLHYAADRRASFVFHGVTHQTGKMRNPWTGASGDDFEFWDRPRNAPLLNDSVDFVQNRVEDGLELLEAVGVRPVAWETPHYQASPLDYTIFARDFAWNIGRAIYFPFTKIQGGGEIADSVTMDHAGPTARTVRAAGVKGLQVSYPPGLLPAGQFYPYEIYGDSYGQRVIPENVGNVQPYLNEQVLRAAQIDDLIRIVRRNAVLRDSWASFFVHPFEIDDHANGGLAGFAGQTDEIERLVRAVREAGYEFIDLKQWMAQAPTRKAAAPIERYLPGRRIP